MTLARKQFDKTTLPAWQQLPLQRAQAALAEGRLAHALLICGTQRIGKRAVAEHLAQSILCRERSAQGAACGHCRSCVLFAARTPASAIEVDGDGRSLYPDGRSGHPDVLTITFEINEKTDKLRSVISVDQIRALGQRFALTPQMGGAQVALIVPADGMNANAANALLKTLEEPMQGRYVLLVTAHPMQLPATIRSRCQRIELHAPDGDDALGWLVDRGHAGAAAGKALDAARGHPGLAAHWLEDGLLEIRDRVRADLIALAAGKSQPLQLASTWLTDAHVAQRIAFAAEAGLELQAMLVGASAHDPDPQLGRLTANADFQKLSAWFDSANRTRELLSTQIRSDLALGGLLHDWCEAVSAASARSNAPSAR